MSSGQSVPSEAVERAAIALYDVDCRSAGVSWDGISAAAEIVKDYYRRRARAALEAAREVQHGAS